MTQQAEIAAQRLLGAPEYRSASFDEFELRASKTDRDQLHFSGYAARFDSPAHVGRGPAGPFEEMLNPRAFDTTLRSKPDLVLRTEHRNLPIARTTAGNLRLSVDSKGLVVDATLDRRDPDVQALEIKLENRNLNQMSYVFKALRDKWNDDYTQRELLEVSLDKGDVSVVTYGANDQTTARMGSLQDVVDALSTVELAEARSLTDPTTALDEAIAHLTRLRGEVAPKESRTLSVAEALRVIEGRE